MDYTFEDSIYKRKYSTEQLDQLKKFWKKKRVSTVDKDKDLLTHFKVLPNCTFFCSISDNLEKIPYLPKCKMFINNNNKKIKHLKPLPECKTFSCRKTSITKLPSLPNAKFVQCSKNKLTSIGKLPKCNNLDCHSNPITSIAKNTNLKKIDYEDTPLFKKHFHHKN